jgi:hypothetical protein
VRKRKSATPLTNKIGSKFAGKKFVRKRAFVGAAMLLIIPYIGSSLAATVTINGGSGSGAIEFGQGSQITVVCDSTIKTSIDEEWYASGSPSPYFRVKTISLTGINNASALNATTDNQGCGGKALTFKLYATNTIVDLGPEGENAAVFTVPAAGATSGEVPVTGATGMTAASSVGASETSITLTLSSSLNIDATTITRVVLESSS